MQKPVKWGIIGPGSIAHQFANDLKLISQPQQVTALLGHSEEGIKEFTDEFHPAQVFRELDDFVQQAAIDIAYIATPHTLHHKQAMACINKGIPVLVEKPVAVNQDECRELMAAAAQQNCFLMEAMWIRFLPSVKQLLSLVKEGKIGRLLSIRASIGFRAPHDPSNRFFDPLLGGGSLLDIGIYPVFLACLLAGRPDAIKAVATLSEKKIDETCSALFHYPDGQQAMISSSIVAESDWPAEIIGEKGMIRLLHPWFEKSPGLELTVFDGEKKVYPFSWEGHGLQFEAEEAIACLQAGKKESEVMPLSFSLSMLGVMDEIRGQTGVSYPLNDE